MKALALCCMVLVVSMAGCATNQAALLTKTYEVKELRAPYEKAFQATIQVLMNNGYVIKGNSLASGVIQGETGPKNDLFGRMVNTEVTATIQRQGDDAVKERVAIIRVFTNQYNTKVGSKVVDDPALFRKLFDEIQKEIRILQ